MYFRGEENKLYLHFLVFLTIYDDVIFNSEIFYLKNKKLLFNL